MNVNGLPAVNVNGLPARRLRGAAAAKHATKPIDGCGPIHVHTKPIDGCGPVSHAWGMAWGWDAWRLGRGATRVVLGMTRGKLAFS